MRDVDLERRVDCPLHPGQIGSLRPIGRVLDPVTGRALTIVRCGICGVGLTNPFPSEATVSALYEGRGSGANFDPIRGSIIDRLKDISARRDLDAIRRRGGLGRIGRVLDYGTGNGRFAIASHRAFDGCRVDAVDFDVTPPPSLARDGITYRTVEAFRADTTSYDLILLRHVVEHVHDPIGFMRGMAARLAAGGILYVEVPNRESAHIRLFGELANAYQVPFHLFHFDAPSLAAAMSAAGLEAVIAQKEMPLAGGILATLLHQERRLVHQLAGVALQPAQLSLDVVLGRPCLAAIARTAAASPARG